MNDNEDGVQDLTAHLTNTCLQDETTAQQTVFMLFDLVGKSMLDPQSHEELSILTEGQADQIMERIGVVVGETFQAGLAMPNHFSVSGRLDVIYFVKLA